MNDIEPDTMAKLQRFLPIRIVIRRDRDGRIEGKTEESFSMAWSRERVNIFWSGKAYSIIGEHIIDAIKDAAHNVSGPDQHVFDPIATDSPVVINWEYWLAAMKAGASRKYDARNAPFRSTQDL